MKKQFMITLKSSGGRHPLQLLILASKHGHQRSSFHYFRSRGSCLFLSGCLSIKRDENGKENLYRYGDKEQINKTLQQRTDALAKKVTKRKWQSSNDHLERQRRCVLQLD